jgi:hypothetical protein
MPPFGIKVHSTLGAPMLLSDWHHIRTGKDGQGTPVFAGNLLGNSIWDPEDYSGQ